MHEKNRWEELLNEMGEMLKTIQSHQGSISQNLSPEVLLELERLEKGIELFDELNQKSYEAAKIDITTLRAQTGQSSEISSRDKKLLELLKQIEKEAKELHARNALSLNRPKVSDKRDSEKKSMKERRKKFKSIGSERGWIPL